MKLPHPPFREDRGVFFLPHVARLPLCTLGGVLGDGFAIHRTIDERTSFGPIEIPRMKCLCDMEIGYLDIADKLLIVAIVEDGMTFGLTRRDMTDVEIRVLRGIVSSAITEVIGFETEDGSVCLLDGDVADMHVADEAATILI